MLQAYFRKIKNTIFQNPIEYYQKWLLGRVEDLRYEYDLNVDSVVFDLGGYYGNFAKRISEKFHCHVYVFEPVKEYFYIIQDNLRHCDKVHLFNYGISDKNTFQEIGVQGDASGLYNLSAKREVIELRSIGRVFEELGIKYVDLIKINVEGAEYGILFNILKQGIAKNFGNIQVQFHKFIEGAKQKKRKIRRRLAKTHRITFGYPFIFENWVISEKEV